MTTDTFYVIECESKEFPVEVLLNGIPIALRGPEHGIFIGQPVNQYMIDGVNEIELVVHPGAVPSESRTGPLYGPRLEHVVANGDGAWARIARYPSRATVGGPDGVELLRLEWPRKDARVLSVAGSIARAYRERGLRFDDHVPTEVPVVATKRGNFGQMYGRWKWEDAPVLKLDGALVKEALAVLERVRKGLARGDADAFLEIKEIPLEETAAAYDDDASVKRNFIASDAIRLAMKPGFALEPIDPAQADFRLVAGGRMLECVAKDWRPILRQKATPEGQAFFPFFLARIDGKLQGAR